MMEAARTSETSVDNHFTRQYNPEDSSEHEKHCLRIKTMEHARNREAKNETEWILQSENGNRV
jgi:hypothetical protein